MPWVKGGKLGVLPNDAMQLLQANSVAVSG